nr:MAG TPA: hypothetical protein [Caudoviricetes sp.]
MTSYVNAFRRKNYICPSFDVRCLLALLEKVN